VIPDSPYKGLDPFGESDLDELLFFGREREREIVVANLIASRLTVLYGATGVGKSSLLRAAVVRSLRELPEAPLVVVFDHWRDDPATGLVDAFAEGVDTPTTDGLHAVVESAQASRDVYIVLDQMEEYFVYHADAGPFESDLARLVGEPLRVNVLLSLREDSLAKLDQFKPRIPGVYANSLRLDRLDRSAARAAILGPVERWNELADERVAVEEALVEAVLDGVEAGQIEYAAGGLGAADSNGRPRSVEAPYLQLVMQRLWDAERSAGSTVLREETLNRLGGARRVVADHLEVAVDALTPDQRDIAARLFTYLVTPSGTKIAHELPDLAEYAGVNEGEAAPVVETLSRHRILRPDEAGRTEIFHDVLAGEVLAWRRRHAAESALQHERVEARKRHRRLVWLAGSALFGFVLMAMLTVFALTQRSNARDQARMARAHELEALSAVRLAADPELSLVLAVEAARLAPSDTAAAALRNALRESRVRTVVPVGEPLLAAALRGKRALSATADGSLVAADSRTGRILGTTGGGTRAKHASFAANGTALFTGRDGRLRRTPPGGDTVEVPRVSGALRAEISRDGRLAVVVVNGGARLVDLETGMTQGQFSHPGAFSAAISDRNGRVATGSSDGSVRVWAARDGTLLRTIPDQGHIQALSFTPVGTQIASASSDGLARIWIIRTGELRTTVAGDATGLTDVGFSTDAAHVVTASKDGTVRVSKADTGAQLLSLSGHGERVTSAVFSGPVGSRVVSASLDETARIWDALYQPVLAELAAVPTTATDLVVGDDGRIRVTAGTRTYVLDPDTGERISIENADRPTRTIAGPGGMTATIRGNTVVLRTPEERSVLQGHRARVLDAAFSPDGTLLATGSKDGDVRLWTIATGDSRPLTHNSAVRAVAFSPDGRWLVTAAGRVGLWDPDNGLVVRLQGHDGPVTAIAFDPSGRNILSGGVDGTVRKYPCDVCGDLGELVEMAETRLAVTGRALTDEERERYLGS
jgi:WD40 repeat protein